MLKDYLLPASVDEALQHLQAYSGKAAIIAGGTDIMVNMAEKKISPEALIDISRIGGFKQIEEDGEFIKVGAGVTHTQAARSPLLKEKAPVLAQACREVGSLQIRNMGTLVGNIVSAQPAADAAVALVALGAVAEIADLQGKREESVEELYAGIGACKVDCRSQLVTALRFKALGLNQGSAFKRLAKRKALALPMLNVAVVLSLKEGAFEWVRIVMAPVGPGPVRAATSESILIGAPVSHEVIEKAAAAAREQAAPRDSALRGSAAYRRDVLKVLVRRALEDAVSQAGGSL